jgi:hypothetical protein
MFEVNRSSNITRRPTPLGITRRLTPLGITRRLTPLGSPLRFRGTRMIEMSFHSQLRTENALAP